MKQKIILWIFVLILLSSFASAADDYMLIEQATTSGNTQLEEATWTFVGQTLDINTTVYINSISIYTQKRGDPAGTDQLNLSIFGVTGGEPDETNLVEDCGLTSTAALGSGSLEWWNLTCSGTTPLSAGTEYSFVINCPADQGCTTDNGYDIALQNPSAYGGGNCYYDSRADQMGSWDVYGTNGDMAFRVYVSTADVVGVTQTYNTSDYEGNTNRIQILFKDGNLTTNTNATLTYNNTEYNGTINYVNSSYVEFYYDITVPFVDVNTTNIPFHWNYSLAYANGSFEDSYTSSLNQQAIWNLNKYPRINITATNMTTGLDINSFTIDDGIKTISTTNGIVYLWETANGSKNVQISGDGISTSNATLTFNQTFYNYDFESWELNSFNFTFLDEATNLTITGTEITVEFISDTFNYNYTTTTGKLYASLLFPQTYIIRYSANQTYQQNSFVFTLTNRTHNDLYLYMTNESTERTVTVYDGTTLNALEGAYVYLQKRLEDGTFATISMGVTDPSGQVYFYTTSTDYYKFLVDFPFGTRVLSTDKFYIKTTAINLYVDLQADVAQTYFDETTISSTLSWNAALRRFDVTWSDTASAATQFCLYTKKYGYYGKEILNTTCSTSSSGSIETAVPAANATYYAVFTAVIDGDERVIRTGYVDIPNDKLNAGAFGLFMTAVLVILFTFVGAMHILALIFASAGLAVAKMLGLIALGWGYIIVIFIASLILAIVINMRR